MKASADAKTERCYRNTSGGIWTLDIMLGRNAASGNLCTSSTTIRSMWAVKDTAVYFGPIVTRLHVMHGGKRGLAVVNASPRYLSK